MSFCCTIKKHCQLSEKEWNEIAFLKDQHWTHGIESQKAWIANNFEDDDVHMILYQDNTPVAYASLNVISCVMDSAQEEMLGLGGVCVTKMQQKQGLGRKIVEYANAYIADAKKPGLLLCHKELTAFYSLCGWEIVGCQNVSVAGANFVHFVMSYGKQYCNVNCLAVPKNF